MDTRNFQGFTLIELMVTIGILAVLASIAIPAYNGYIKTSHKTECNNEIAAIKLAESEYYLDKSSYFIGGDTATLQSNSNGTYVAASSTTPECSYSVTYDSKTNKYTITASPTTTGHLKGEPDMTYTGP